MLRALAVLLLWLYRCRGEHVLQLADFEAYVDRIAKQGSWIGSPELEFIGRHFDMPVEVLAIFPEGILSVTHNPNGRHAPMFTVLYQGHYNATMDAECPSYDFCCGTNKHELGEPEGQQLDALLYDELASCYGHAEASRAVQAKEGAARAAAARLVAARAAEAAAAAGQVRGQAAAAEAPSSAGESAAQAWAPPCSPPCSPAAAAAAEVAAEVGAEAKQPQSRPMQEQPPAAESAAAALLAPAEGEARKQPRLLLTWAQAAAAAEVAVAEKAACALQAQPPAAADWVEAEAAKAHAAATAAAAAAASAPAAASSASSATRSLPGDGAYLASLLTFTKLGCGYMSAGAADGFMIVLSKRLRGATRPSVRAAVPTSSSEQSPVRASPAVDRSERRYVDFSRAPSAFRLVPQAEPPGGMCMMEEERRIHPPPPPVALFEEPSGHDYVDRETNDELGPDNKAYFTLGTKCRLVTVAEFGQMQEARAARTADIEARGSALRAQRRQPGRGHVPRPRSPRGHGFGVGARRSCTRARARGCAARPPGRRGLRRAASRWSAHPAARSRLGRVGGPPPRR